MVIESYRGSTKGVGVKMLEMVGVVIESGRVVYESGRGSTFWEMVGAL